MVIEGDSALTTFDTTLSCNPSSVNLGGDSSGFPLDVWTHGYCGYYDFTLNPVTKDGSALRGTRASIFANDEESG